MFSFNNLIFFQSTLLKQYFFFPFMLTRDPNSADVPDWSTFTVPELEYKEIAVGLPTQRALRADDNYFWNSLAPALKACA